MDYIPCRFNNKAPCTFRIPGNCEHCPMPPKYGFEFYKQGSKWCSRQIWINGQSRQRRISFIERQIHKLKQEIEEIEAIPSKPEE